MDSPFARGLSVLRKNAFWRKFLLSNWRLWRLQNAWLLFRPNSCWCSHLRPGRLCLYIWLEASCCGLWTITWIRRQAKLPSSFVHAVLSKKVARLVAVRSHRSSLQRNGHKQLAPRHPSHLQSATDHNETAILNRLFLTQVPVESKGQRKNELSKIWLWTTDSLQDAFSAPLARSECSQLAYIGNVWTEGTLTRGNGIRVSLGMTVQWHSLGTRKPDTKPQPDMKQRTLLSPRHGRDRRETCGGLPFSKQWISMCQASQK